MKSIKSRRSGRMPWRFRTTMSVLAAAVLLVVGTLSAAIVRADSYQQQIDSLNAQNAQNQNNVDALALQAADYQDAINKLQQQIAGLQAAIAANQAKQAELQSEIETAQAQLDHEKEVLGEDLKAMYVSGQMSPIEMLATSKDLSSYVDAATYRSAVQNKIQDTLARITKLQNELREQKTEVEGLLATQRQQKVTLDSAQAQQNSLLAMNQSQQASFNTQIKANNDKIDHLRAEQAAAERAAFAGSSSPTGGVVTYKNMTGLQVCGGGYNFHCSGAQDTWLDAWGEYNRECVSYAAWYEANHGHYVPAFGYTVYGGQAQGNAYQWHGVIVNTGAASVVYYDQAVANEGALAGDIVYMPIGVLGHVGSVLYDEGGGWVRVGQYNIYDAGMYNEMDLKITPNLEFYRFH